MYFSFISRESNRLKPRAHYTTNFREGTCDGIVRCSVDKPAYVPIEPYRMVRSRSLKERLGSKEF